MYRSRWRRTPVLVASAMAAMAGLTITACGGGSAGRAPGPGLTGAAEPAAQAGPITSARLVGALLTRINGVSAAAPAAGGSYQSLPQVKAIERQVSGISAPSRPCARAALTGLRSGGLGSAPAAGVSFKVGRNGVSELLAAPSRTAATAVLRRALPASCAHYQATVGGNDTRYTVQEKAVTGIGEQARVLSMQAAGHPAGDIWSVTFRGDGFIGSITVVGPNASELAVRELGLQAYGFAAKSLS